jgi:hypothetical protein
MFTRMPLRIDLADEQKTGRPVVDVPAGGPAKCGGVAAKTFIQSLMDVL